MTNNSEDGQFISNTWIVEVIPNYFDIDNQSISYTRPHDKINLPVIYYILYYGVSMPIAFIGNLLTCILIVKRLKWRNSVPDVLVGGLALNDFLTCLVVFTPSLFAEIFQRFPDSKRFCQFHAVTTVWYLYTTFAIIVLMSVDRWLALYKPFYYQAKVTPLLMKFVIASLGAFCLLLGSIPLIFYPVMPRAGWYCAVAQLHFINGTIESTLPDLVVKIRMTFIITGMVILLTCTAHIIVIITRKKAVRHNHGLNKENRFARLMGIVAAVFLVTWIPSWVSMKFCLFLDSVPVCQQSMFWGSRLINIGVAINPILYGALKRAYRAEYKHLLYTLFYYLLCCRIAEPEDERLVFGAGASYRINVEKVLRDRSNKPPFCARGGSSSGSDEPIQADGPSCLADREETPKIPKREIIALKNASFLR